MSDLIHPEDALVIGRMTQDDLVNMAVELDIMVPAEIDRETLVLACVTRILERASREGLPFSKYDRDDLSTLPDEDLRALAGVLRLRPTVDAMLRAGRRTYKMYQRNRPNSATALLLPSLLPIIARAARLGSTE